MSNLNVPAEIDAFLESILNESGLSTLDEKMRQDMKEELFYQLDNFLAAIIVEALSPEDVEIFIKMNEEGKSKEEVEAFMAEKIPNFQDFFANAFMKFKALYLENIEKAKKERQIE